MSFIDRKQLFAEIRAIKGSGLTQAEVDRISALLPLELAVALPVIPPHPRLPQSVLLAAIKTQSTWNIPASVRLAQYAVESAWGTKMSGINNPFGIKDVDGHNATVVKTREETKGGKSYYISAGFENFTSIEEAFDIQAKLLATGKPYAKARAQLPDADAFADALTGVYATANSYGTVLKSIMKSNNLYQYDEVVV